jgi:hypothetical protein
LRSRSFGRICGDRNSWNGSFGHIYANDAKRDGKTIFTHSEYFELKQIEVVEIIAETALPQSLLAFASRISFLSLPTRSERLLN